MSNKLYKILAINPGSRYIGIAFFYGYALRNWQIENVRGYSTNDRLKKAKKIILWLIERYEPDVVALKILHPSRSSIHLKKLVIWINKLAQEKSIRISSYSIGQIEDFFLSDKLGNKVKLAEVLVKRYPGLMFEFNKELFNKNPYYVRMFEAVALGAICCDQLNNN